MYLKKEWSITLNAFLIKYEWGTCFYHQVMAIATLERCYNNKKVFEGIVKIRKGEAVKMILGTSSLDATKAVFKHFCNSVSSY